MTVTACRRFLLTLIILGLSGCSMLPPGLSGSQGSQANIPSPTPLPAAEVIFTVTPPQGTPDNADLAILLMDELTGFPYVSDAIPMTRLADGKWQARVTPPVGTLLNYRYVRRAPAAADEATAAGSSVRNRVVHIPGPIQFEDLVAAWTDAPYTGSTGRVVGRLFDAVSLQPLLETLVVVSGNMTFTDAQGEFRIDDLPPGLHTLTAFSPTGSHRTAQQGAIVAADSATPAELGLAPAPLVPVEFRVAVPSDTPVGVSVQLAGNLRQLGNTFADLPGSVRISASRVPSLVRVDDTHYLFLTQLYAGSDLHYRYTLGDGLWNAERNNSGAFFNRQVIIPEAGLLLEDVVTNWHPIGKASVTFHVTTPPETPPSDTVSIQMNPFTWFEPLPMGRLSDREWVFTLNGPLEFGGPLTYRYCRNLQCGIADDSNVQTPAGGRQVTAADSPVEVVDTVSSWLWWGTQLPPTTVVAPEITPRPGFEAGVEFLPSYDPTWTRLLPLALGTVPAIGGNAVVLTPTWILQRNNPNPILAFDPTAAPFADEFKTWIGEANRLGLRVSVRPSLRWQGGEIRNWWLEARRNHAWWSNWFEEYRSFLLTYARLAQEAGASELIIGGPDLAPSLPGGLVANGAPSGVPADAEDLWRSLISEVRSTFTGTLAFELDLGLTLQAWPSFLDAFDEIHIYWHAGLGDRNDLTIDEMQETAGGILRDVIRGLRDFRDKPIVVSVEYLSVDGGATGCARLPDEACRPASQFDRGVVADPDLQPDLWEQATAINAVLLEAYASPAVTGFYARRFDPTVGLQDRSASVNGKPAQEVLGYWYPRITGAIAP